MRQLACMLCAVVVFLAAGRLFAEQEVTLKSGASFIGDVTIDGDAVVVKVDEAELRVPLADVAAISPLDAGHHQQAHRLLMTALEAKLMNNAGREVLALLAEAARLDPADPKIAYWYARSLVDAGFGKAASEVFERRREEIANAYPGMSDELAARIKQRLELEKMPAEVVERFDKLNAAAAQPTNVPELRQLAAVFRLIDQNDRPIERSAFHIQSNGQDDNLESFDDGYYVFTFKQHYNNRQEPCRLEINQPGLEPKTFQFTGGSSRVRHVGVFVVQRYDETAKRPFRARIVSHVGEPISGATVTLQAVSPSGNTSDHALSADSDADGRVEILAFPMKYSYRVQAEGFNFQSGNVELHGAGNAGATTAGGAREQQIKLHHAIQATLRVAWMSTAFQGGANASGETTLQVTGGSNTPYRYGQDTPQWIRPVQVEDRMTLQFINMPFGYQGPNASEAWVRIVEAAAEATEDGAAPPAALEKFKALDLNKLESLKEELPQPDTGGRPPGYSGPIVLPAALGNVYVGKLSNRDMRTGQLIQIAFKVIVEEMKADTAEAD